MDADLSLVKYYRRRILTLKNKIDNIDSESSDFQPYLIKQITRGEERLRRKKMNLWI